MNRLLVMLNILTNKSNIINTQESKIDSWLYSCMQIYSIKTYYENLAVYDTSNDNLSFLATRNKYSQSFLK